MQNNVQMSCPSLGGSSSVIAQQPLSEKEPWGAWHLGGAQGCEGQDRSDIQVTGGEPGPDSPVTPLRTRGSREVKLGLELTLLCSPLTGPSPN